MNWNEVFDYDAKTGNLLWKQGRRRGGKVAGCKATTLQGLTYIKVKVEGKLYSAHRVIWEMHTGKPPAKWIDHIDGDGTNNRIRNLREASPSENGYNRKVDVRNKFGVTGVHFDKKKKRFKVSLTVGGKRIHFGSFKTKREAISVARENRLRLHGDYTSQR